MIILRSAVVLTETRNDSRDDVDRRSERVRSSHAIYECRARCTHQPYSRRYSPSYFEFSEHFA